MNQLPPNSLENTAAVFHQVATGENRRRSRYIKLENGKDVFTNQRRERTDLRVVFDDAQSQIRDALLNVTDASRAEASRFLTDIEHDTVTIGTRYRRRAGNIFVRLGIIKPRVKRETLEKGEQLIRESRAARRILEAKTNPRHYDLNLEDRFSNLKMDLRDLCSHDSDYLFKLLQLSERGGSFEYCRKELEEIATDQFRSLLQIIRIIGDSEDCVFERGRWVLKEVEQLTPEMIADRDKRLSDQFYDYLPYINYHWINRELSAYPIRLLNTPAGDLWRRLGESRHNHGRCSGDDFQKKYHPTREELPIWLKLARDLNYSWLLQAVYISVVPSDGREGFYDELNDSVYTLHSFYPRFFGDPTKFVEAFYKLANSGLATIPEFRTAAQLTGFLYAYFLDGIEPAPPHDYLVVAVHKILKDYDFPKIENFEIVTSLIKDMENLYEFQIYDDTTPDDYRISELLTLLQKEWLQNPEYKALVCEHIPIIRKMLTPADVPEENSPVEAAILEVYGALKRNEIKTPQEAEEILNGIFHLQRRYEKAFEAIDNEEADRKKFISKFSAAHTQVSKLLEPFPDDHPIKRLMSAPPLPEGSTLNRKVLAFIFSKIESGELEDVDKAEQIYRDVKALKTLNDVVSLTEGNYEALFRIVKRGVAKNQTLVDLIGDDIPLLRVLADPTHLPLDATFELKVLGMALQTEEPLEIMTFRFLKDLEEEQESETFWSDPRINDALFLLCKLRAQFTEQNESLDLKIRHLIPRAWRISNLASMPERENEPFPVSALRLSLKLDDEKLCDTLLSAFEGYREVYLGTRLMNRYALKHLISNSEELSEPALAFLKEKLPLVVHIMEAKKRTPHKASCNKDTPIDDLIMWGQDLRKFLLDDRVDLPFEETCLALGIEGEAGVSLPESCKKIGRGTTDGFKPMGKLDDNYFKVLVAAHEGDTAYINLEETAVSAEYALELQNKYGSGVSYNDNYTVQKKLLENEQAGDYSAFVNGKERKLYSQVIQRALPGQEIVVSVEEKGENGAVVEKKMIKLSEQLSPKELHAFLEYCYTDSIAEASPELLMALYHKAEAIGSQPLKGYCCAMLLANVTKDNVLQRYDEACRMNIDPLKQHCMRFLQAFYYQNRESFTESQKIQIGQIVKTFFDTPVVTPQPIPLDQAIKLEHNFSLIGSDGKKVGVNLELLMIRSSLVDHIVHDGVLTSDTRELAIDLFDSNTLTYVEQFVSTGELPPNLTVADLTNLRTAADYFDMPALQFQLNALFRNALSIP